LRPWPNQAHFSAKHGQELRKFVDPVLSKKRSNRGYSAVHRSCPRGPTGFCIFSHGPKLQDFEFLAVKAHAFLPEKQRSAGFTPDGECRGRHQGPSEKKSKES